MPVEDVARQWVEAYYNSEFKTAKSLSTNLTKIMIDTVALQLLDEEDIIPFQINDILCSVNGDSAVCTYTYKDDLDEYEESVHLIAQNGFWLVNEPLTDDSDIEKEIEKYFEEYEKMLNEELENAKDEE